MPEGKCSFLKNKRAPMSRVAISNLMIPMVTGFALVNLIKTGTPLMKMREADNSRNIRGFSSFKKKPGFPPKIENIWINGKARARTDVYFLV